MEKADSDDPVNQILRSIPRLQEGRYLTPGDLGEIVNLKVPAILRRIARGSSLPRITRVGRRPLFSPGDVAAWLVEARQK